VARSTLFKRLKDWGMTRQDTAEAPMPSDFSQKEPEWHTGTV